MTTYRFVVLDLPLAESADALRQRADGPMPPRAVPGFRVRWARDASHPRLLVRSPWRLSAATVAVELLPWDDARTELGLRLERRRLLPDDRYDRVAAALLLVLADGLRSVARPTSSASSSRRTPPDIVGYSSARAFATRPTPS